MYEQIELRYADRHGVKNKLQSLEFDDLKDLESILKVYEILNSQHTKDLTIQKSLESTIRILDHQIRAAKKVKNEFNGRVLLADEVGLGKTIEAGILLKEYFVTGMIKNALILTPPSLRTQWKDELKVKFGLDFIANKDDPRFEDFDRHGLLISSLHSAAIPQNADKLSGIEWDVVVVDEAHRLKNSATRNHKFVKELQKKFIFLLTATPIQNNLQELYNMIEVIHPGHLGSWKNFASTYTIDKKARVINPSKRAKLQDLLKQIVIRTTRDEVRSHLQLTDRIPKTHILDASTQEIAIYNRATEFVRKLWLEEKRGRNFILPLMTLQRQISSSTSAARGALRKKKKQFDKYGETLEQIITLSDSIKTDSKMLKLEEIIAKDPEAKYLIFTEFIDTQDYIFDRLEENEIPSVKFNGSMSTSDRDTAVSKFRRDIPVLVSTEAGGEGQNFQFCSNVINYDLPWNPMRVEQRVGRVHRIGQESDVRIHNVAIKGSIEEYVLKLLFDKINLFKMTIGDLDLLFEDEGFDKLPQEIFESYMSSVTKRDIKNKFSALGEKWSNNKQQLHDDIMQFDDQVFANFDLSVLNE